MTRARLHPLRYALLPGIVPRVGRLLGGGFAVVSWYMGLALNAAGLLPSRHPCLRAANYGRFNLFAVLAAAAERLELRWDQADRILIFTCILAGLALLFAQLVLVVLAVVLSTPAVAAAVDYPFVEWFVVDNPSQYIDRIILDRVFGVPGVFESCVSTGVECVDMYGNPLPSSTATFPFPIHVALHGLFGFYSNAMAMVAAVIVLYFAVVVTVETATTGTPFGKRFSHAWALPRVILFAALMIPTPIGVSMGQMAVLHVAKYGGAFATNAWNQFNETLSAEYVGRADSYLAVPNPPEAGALVQFMFTAKACQILENSLHGDKQGPVDAYLVRGVGDGLLEGGENYKDFVGTSYADAQKFTGYGTIAIRFGIRDADKHSDERGFVKPVCGQITIEPQDLNEVASQDLYADYMQIVADMWQDEDFENAATCLLKRSLPHAPDPDCRPVPDAVFAQGVTQAYQAKISAAIRASKDAHRGDTVPPELLAKGWAGAGMWYDRISRMSRAFTSAVLGVPQPGAMPLLMAEVAELRAAALKDTTQDGAGQRYNPSLAGDKAVELQEYPFGDGVQVASALNKAYTLFDVAQAVNAPEKTSSGSWFLDAVNYMLGTQGIFDIRYNADVHPLAQITALGKAVIERSVQHLFVGGVSWVAEKITPKKVSSIIKAGSNLMFTFGMIGIVIGFILAYTTPFMPMLYFLFAVSGWIKGVFEAMVAVPLWALAHLRIDGDGLPGRDASAGYMLLLEIFLRPILIVAGLLAAMMIFTGTVTVFHEIYDLVLLNLAGHGRLEVAPGMTNIELYRGPVDEFFFTVIYVVVVYMVGASCFKLIDEIPNQLMRWIGFQVQTFQEGVEDQAAALQQRVYSGTMLLSNQAKEGSGRLAAIAATVA